MTAAGILLVAGGLVLVYAGLTGDNPIAQLQRVLAPQGKAPTGKGAPATKTAPVPAGPLKGKPVPVS